MKKGDWLFTCRMEPLQFYEWDEPDDLGELDNFSTLEGSNHSRLHCGLKPISEEYARWFIENQWWNWYSRILTANVPHNSEWRKVGDGFYVRSSYDPDIEYMYMRRVGGAYYFAGLRILGAWWTVNTDKQFKRTRDVWDAYEFLIKTKSQEVGLVYEGY